MDSKEMANMLDELKELVLKEMQKQVDKMQPVVSKVSKRELPFLIHVMEKTLGILKEDNPEAVEVAKALDDFFGYTVELRKIKTVHVTKKKRGST